MSFLLRPPRFVQPPSGDLGEIAFFAGATIPVYWLEAEGTAVSRTTYSDLFDKIGTTFGVGDGSTTFNLPDLRGRTPFGAGAGAGLTARTLADEDGVEAHQLSEAELASHIHTAGRGPVVGLVAGSTYYEAAGASNTSYTGDDTGHETMQPFGVCKSMVYAGV